MRINVDEKIIAVKDKIFKPTSYDIRAYVGEVGNFFGKDAVLTPEVMQMAGALMGSVEFIDLSGKKFSLQPGEFVVVGYDNGPTSQALAEAFAEGLMSQGINVYNIGIASSGQVYHNQSQLNASGHVQITRSHVEVTTNGAKFGIGTQGIHTYLLKQMNEALAEGVIGRDDCEKGYMIDKTAEGRKLYYQKMKDMYGQYFKEHPRKIAVNLFGGTGLQYKELFQDIFGSELVILGDELDVNGGDLLADPTRTEMLVRVPKLQETLESGLRVHSFDLDADRGSLTEGASALNIGSLGHYLGDSLAYILADYKLSISVPKLIMTLNDKNIEKDKLDEIHKITTTVLVDPRYTGAVNHFVHSKGGVIYYNRKGHSLWKETMIANMKKLAELAGAQNIEEFMAYSKGYQDIQIEASLHMFATDPLDGTPKDDAIQNVFILEMLIDALNIKSLNEYFSKISRRFTTKEIRTNSISNEVKESITTDIVDFIRAKFSGNNCNIVEFDGQIRAEWDTGFIMYGMSNTSPKLTMMAEGSDEDERNCALAYVLALHNDAKKRYGDNLKMDISENQFFKEDPSYNMTEPDKIDFNDVRVKKFISQRGLK